MTLKRIFPIAFGIAMIAVASVQGYAFMMATSELQHMSGDEVAAIVDSLAAALDNTELSSDDKLAMLDEALEQIDDLLDRGVDNEVALLKARDAIVDMRLNVDTSKETFAKTGGIFGGGGGGGGGGVAGGVCGGGHGAAGGGASGLGGVAALAGAVGIAVGVPTSNSEPGITTTTFTN